MTTRQTHRVYSFMGNPTAVLLPGYRFSPTIAWFQELGLPSHPVIAALTVINKAGKHVAIMRWIGWAYVDDIVLELRWAILTTAGGQHVLLKVWGQARGT